MTFVSKYLEVIRNFVLKNTPNKMMQKQMIELYSIDKTVFKKG